MINSINTGGLTQAPSRRGRESLPRLSEGGSPRTQLDLATTLLRFAELGAALSALAPVDVEVHATQTTQLLEHRVGRTTGISPACYGRVRLFFIWQTSARRLLLAVVNVDTSSALLAVDSVKNYNLGSSSPMSGQP